jgi:hypothetical protein
MNSQRSLPFTCGKRPALVSSGPELSLKNALQRWIFADTSARNREKISINDHMRHVFCRYVIKLDLTSAIPSS